MGAGLPRAASDEALLPAGATQPTTERIIEAWEPVLGEQAAQEQDSYQHRAPRLLSSLAEQARGGRGRGSNYGRGEAVPLHAAHRPVQREYPCPGQQ